MNSTLPETGVETVDGNCIIVTTLLSSSTHGSQTPLEVPLPSWSHGNWSPPKSDSDLPLSLPTAPAVTPAFDLTPVPSAMRTLRDNRAEAPVGQTAHPAPPLDSTPRHAGVVAVPHPPHALLAVDPNGVVPRNAFKRAGHLGPLVIVRPPRNGSAPRGVPLSEAEHNSYHRALEALRGRLAEVTQQLADSQESVETTVLARVAALDASRRAETRQERRQFDETLTALRAENAELLRDAKAAAEDAARAIAKAQEAAQREWGQRLDAQSRQWRARLESTISESEARVEELLGEKLEALRLVHNAARTTEELGTALRQMTREKAWAERERDALAAQLGQTRRQNGGTADQKREWTDTERAEMEAEMCATRDALREAEGRERALLLQLEVCGEEAAADAEGWRQQVGKARRELEAERERGADLVRLYGNEMESVHAQLSEALQRNADLTKKLAKSR